MTTYRTGGYWGRTIVRVGTQPPDAEGCRPDDELVGVMDDPALAERICELLNADETCMCSSHVEPHHHNRRGDPGVPVRELAARLEVVRERAGDAMWSWSDAAPAATPSEPQAAETGPGVVGSTPGGSECICGHDGLDAMFHLMPCPIAVRRIAPRRRLKSCVERWPGAEIDGDYDPRCCRFPKSCSASVWHEEAVTEDDLEPL